MTSEELNKLKKLVKPIAEKYNVDRVSLFGSRARGDNRPDSDYDFLVLCPNIKGFFAVGGLYADLEEAIGTKIDLLDEESPDQEFVNEIREDAVVLYEQAR